MCYVAPSTTAENLNGRVNMMISSQELIEELERIKHDYCYEDCLRPDHDCTREDDCTICAVERMREFIVSRPVRPKERQVLLSEDIERVKSWFIREYCPADFGLGDIQSCNNMCIDCWEAALRGEEEC